jgi:hypothetical protein
MRLGDRVAEIRARYGASHSTAVAITGCVEEFERAAAESETRIAGAGIGVSGSLANPD